MLFPTVLALLTTAVVQAAPTARSAFSKECSDFELRDSWLIANCPVSPDSKEKVQSAVFLPNKITNREGSIGWAVDGAFSRSCKDCSILDGILKCSCQSTWDGVKRTQLNLEEHIANYDGVLLSDLKGRPAPSKKASPAPVPSDFNYKFQQGTYSCYGKDCGNTPDPISGGPGCDGGFSVSGTGPVACYAFHWPIAGDYWSAFQSARLTSASKAWEVAVYDNLDCSKKPIAVVKPEDEDKCLVFDKKAVAVSVTPLWNADA
jgi:hypothetical protein